MATSRHANGGLSTSDLERIRDKLATGRRPRVMFTEAAGQIAGQTGQVVQLTDPAISEEWLVVRFGHDELPFSPADLTLPARNNGKSLSAPAPSPRKEEPMPTTAARTPAGKAAQAPGEKAAQAPGGKPAPPPAPEQKPVKQAAATRPMTGAKPAARPAKPGRARTPAGLTITLAYSEGEWTVAAHQGSRVLVKPYLVKPVEALKLVGMVDVPGVQEAVKQLVAAERAEAEQRADQLRAQLAQVEAQLAELRQAR